MKWDIDTLLKKKGVADSRRDLFQNILEDAYKIAMPERDQFSNPAEGQDRQTNLYISKGMEAQNAFINKIQGLITPTEQKWFSFKAGPNIPDERKDEVNEALDKISDILYAGISQSNFDTSISEFYSDLFASTGALLVQEGTDDEPLNFIAVNSADLSINEGAFGAVEEIYREFKLKKYLVTAQWPDAKVELLEGEDDKEFTFVEATYLNRDNNKWEYVIFEKEIKKELVKRFYDTNPWIILRWTKQPNEVWGRGPLLHALPDLKMLNAISKYSLQGLALKMIPTFTVTDDGVIDVDKLQVKPGAVNLVGRNGGPSGPSIMPLQVGGDANYEQFKTTEIKESIDKLTFNDRLPPDAGGVRSATEIIERMNEKKIDISSALGRIQREFIKPLLKRTLSILWNKGMLPEGVNPEGFFSGNVDTVILSPISKQQSLEDVQNVVQAFSVLASFDPNLANTVFKTQEIAEYVATKMGVKAKHIRGPQERAEYMQAQQQAEEAQVDKDQARQMEMTAFEEGAKQ